MRPIIALAAVAVALAATDIAWPQNAPDGECVSGDVESALQVRTIQSDLMIAAYACDQLALYSKFSMGEAPTLSWASDQLDSYFTTKRGDARGATALVQHLADAASQRCLADTTRCCSESANLLKALDAPKRDDLRQFVAPLLLASQHGFRSCQPRSSYVVYTDQGMQTIAAAAVSDTTPQNEPPQTAPSTAPPLSKVPVPKPKPLPVEGGPIAAPAPHVDVSKIPVPRVKPPSLGQRSN